jgi:hypothetical protein
MDPVIANLANKVLIILTPYAAKTAKEFVQLIGETGYEKAKNLFNKLRDSWKNDPASSWFLLQINIHRNQGNSFIGTGSDGLMYQLTPAVLI